MIDKIDRIRETNKVSKASLTSGCGISRTQYYRYVKGESIAPSDVMLRMIHFLGYEVLLVRRGDND